MSPKRKWFLLFSAAVHAGALGMVIGALRARRRVSPPEPSLGEEARTVPVPVTQPQPPKSDQPAPKAGAKRISPFIAVLLGLGLILLAGFAADVMWRGANDFPRDPEWSIARGDEDLGRAAILRHGCGACHVIPGIRTATGRVGPQLVDFKIQTYLAGVLPNTPDNLVRWIQNPRDINPLTAMPDLGLTEAEARDIAAYIYANTGRGKAVPTTRGAW